MPAKTRQAGSAIRPCGYAAELLIVVIALAVILVFGGQGLRNQFRSGSIATRQMLGDDVPLATQLRLRQEHDD